MANLQHLDVFAGADESRTLYARDSSNLPKNLTGLTVTWSVGRSPWRPDNSNAFFTKTGSVVSASAGTFTVSIAATDTDQLNGDYEHMAKATDVSGNVSVVCQGRFRVRPAIGVP